MSDRDEWLEWRRGGIGGSDIAGLLLPGRWSSPWKVYAEKVGLLPSTESTQRQRIGQRMETVLAAEFEDARPGLHVVDAQQWCEHPKHSWARCTVDGFVRDASDCEVTTFGDSAPRWAGDPLATVQFKTDARYGWPDGPPPEYRAQCIWEMGVTGMTHCFLAVMFGGFRFDVFDIAWDDDAQADWDLMFKTADEFWHEHVLTGTPPPVDGSEATADALDDIYPEHTPGVAVELDELEAYIAERAVLKADAKQIAARLDLIDNTIKEFFGTAEIGTLGMEPVFTYRSSTRAGYTVEPTTVRVLRAAPKPKGKKQ